MNLINLDWLASIMSILILCIGTLVFMFSSKYLEGAKQYRRFHYTLIALTLCLLLLVTANHLILFVVAWSLSNGLLVSLMHLDSSWSQARASATLAGKRLLLSSAILTLALGVLWQETGSLSIDQLVAAPATSAQTRLALGMIVLVASAQCALWPLHKWLLSSLNSPTPVSAIMHAGLVNGGGFLLARFAPLFLANPDLLMLLFVVGLASALMGTLWKLMQPSVKRMLACSTVGQMGFMVVQCGLGLFPAAVAHLCLHGCFKAYLFLRSGAAAQETRLLQRASTVYQFTTAMLCGLATAYSFSLACDKPLISGDSTAFLILLAFLAGFQMSIPFIQKAGPLSSTLAVCLGVTLGTFYGGSVFLIEYVLEPTGIYQPQRLNALHCLGAAGLFLAWLSHHSSAIERLQRALPELFERGYVLALNASEPHPSTITTHRNDYTWN